MEGYKNEVLDDDPVDDYNDDDLIYTSEDQINDLIYTSEDQINFISRAFSDTKPYTIAPLYTMSDDEINEAIDDEALDDDPMYYVLKSYTSEEQIMKENPMYTMSDDQINHALSDAPLNTFSKDQLKFRIRYERAKADRRRNTKPKKRRKTNNGKVQQVWTKFNKRGQVLDLIRYPIF